MSAIKFGHELVYMNQSSSIRDRQMVVKLTDLMWRDLQDECTDQVTKQMN